MEGKVVKLSIDFQRIFESAPNLYLLLSPDLTIIGASDAYLVATLTKRNEIIGRWLFDVFPDNPDDQTADGVSNLSASLKSVLGNKAPHKMPVQKYDIRRPDGVFEARYWSPLNTPVLSRQDDVEYIIHSVEDVTEEERMKKDMSKYIRRSEELEAIERDYILNLKASEDRFIKIFNFSPIAIMITNAETGKIMYVNNAFEKLFHFKRKYAVGKTVVEIGLTDESARDRIIKRITENAGQGVLMEMELKNARGETKEILNTTEIIEIDNRRCYMNAMIDISERKEMEETLRQTNHFLDTILENIPNMVFVKDAGELRFLRFNKAGEDILGYSRNDLLGKNDHDFFAKEQADFFTAKDKEVLTAGQLKDIAEEPIRTAHGERWLHTRKIPVYEHGKPLYLVGISEDITERKMQQDAILQLNKDLEAFSYSVSHDLRAPLRAVTGFARMLQEDYYDKLDDEGKRLLTTISRNAEKMGNLIDDLLNFSRLGRKSVVVKDTDMNEMVRNAINELNKSITHRAEITVAQLHSVKSDPSLMSSVLANLIGNAIKYSSKKENPVVEIKSEANATDVIFSVKDNGAGFDMRYVDKLFGVFQRLHSGEEFEGTGVGLATVKRIINKHGGKVWAEGKIDDGATVYFSLPLI
jgi:PAS domain S-box-containing protein